MWRAALAEDPTTFQVLTPHRGELHGVEALNRACQAHIAAGVIERVGAVDGITLFDKVIQIKNRTRSNWRSGPPSYSAFPPFWDNRMERVGLILTNKHESAPSDAGWEHLFIT